MVPLYVTLALSLFELLVQAAVKLQSATVNFWSLGDEGVLLSVLAVVDLTLTASLVIIVIISGYTNFVTPVEMRFDDRKPGWVGGVDFGQLKLALMASIVAISAIKLLEGFMEISNLSDRELYGLVGIHLTFVVSAALLALADRVDHRPRTYIERLARAPVARVGRPEDARRKLAVQRAELDAGKSLTLSTDFAD